MDLRYETDTVRETKATQEVGANMLQGMQGMQGHSVSGLQYRLNDKLTGQFGGGKFRNSERLTRLNLSLLEMDMKLLEGCWERDDNTFVSTCRVVIELQDGTPTGVEFGITQAELSIRKGYAIEAHINVEREVVAAIYKLVEDYLNS